jgi:hypothetical protein
MPMTAGLAIFKTAFSLSPIFLTGGIAKNIPGGVLPLIVITEAINLPLGLLTGGENIELDGFFANYVPEAGATLIDNEVSEYPFANQAIAANALIAKPLTISLRMICPVRERLGYATKLATMLMVEAALSNHNEHGGLYTVLTPSHFYTNCIMTGMRDISGSESKQSQHTWQLDFMKPLLTMEAALAAQNSLMSKLTGGTEIQGQPAWSGTGASTGAASPDEAGGAAAVPSSGATSWQPLDPVPGVPTGAYNVVPGMPNQPAG